MANFKTSKWQMVSPYLSKNIWFLWN